MTQSSPKKVEAGRKLAMKFPKVSFVIVRIASLPKYPQQKFLGHLAGAYGGGGGEGAPGWDSIRQGAGAWSNLGLPSPQKCPGVAS